nr:unnamed protein product [Digitaria exilis]
MSAQIAPAADHVCYVHCNFCNTVLALFDTQENIKVHGINGNHLEFGSSSSKFRLPMMYTPLNEHHLLQEQTLNARRAGRDSGKKLVDEAVSATTPAPKKIQGLY